MPETEAREQSRRGQVVWQADEAGGYRHAYLQDDPFRYWREEAARAERVLARAQVDAEVQETLRSFLKDGL
jgi:hypothetical protein